MYVPGHPISLARDPSAGENHLRPLLYGIYGPELNMRATLTVVFRVHSNKETCEDGLRSSLSKGQAVGATKTVDGQSVFEIEYTPLLLARKMLEKIPAVVCRSTANPRNCQQHVRA